MERRGADSPTCFVIMPISDVDSYEPGHFGRVYEHVIKPACKAAGLKPIRADEQESRTLTFNEKRFQIFRRRYSFFSI